MTRALCCASAALGLLLVVSIAMADARPTLVFDHRPEAPRTTLELQLGWWTDSQGLSTLHLLAPQIGLRHAFSPSVEVEVDWPFAFVDVSADDPLGTGATGDSTFVSGNPLVAAYYTDDRADGYLRVGLGVAPPIANLDVGSDGLQTDAIAYVYGFAVWGMWDPWLYIPERLSIVLPFQIESARGELLLGADSAAAVMIPTGSSAGNDTDVSLQLAGIVGAREGVGSFGTRLQLVWIPTMDGDNAQIALVPFVQLDFTGGGFAFLRFVVNLDEPLGVLGDGGDVWGLFLGGGGRF